MRKITESFDAADKQTLWSVFLHFQHLYYVYDFVSAQAEHTVASKPRSSYYSHGRSYQATL